MAKICTDHSKLSFDYVPARLPCREHQMEELRNLFQHTIASRATQNAILQGPVGTGKTVTAKKFCIDFKSHCLANKTTFEYVHLNCRQKMTELNVMIGLIRNFQPDFPDRGFSVQDILEILGRVLNERKLHLLVVLDEVDAVLRKKGDIVYNLTRMNEGILKEGKLSLLLISQINIFPFLDSSSLSTLKRTNIVRFERYLPDELYKILLARAEECLVKGSYSDEILKFIAEIAGETGDARHAIELLENAVIAAEAKNAKEIVFEDVRTARAREGGIDMETIKGLEKHEKLTLLAVAQTTKNRSSVTTGEVERQYESLCEIYGEKKRGHTQFWKYLKNLADMGLISTKTEHKQGTTTLVSLTEGSSAQIEEFVEKMLR
ncbi:MAG: AAA family ATPase [Thermoplasmata archaeon]